MAMVFDVRVEGAFGDMNGPLGYWGPAWASTRAAAPRSIRSASLQHDSECAALDRLAETITGRTWAGTALLMDAAFAQAGTAPLQAVLAA